VRGDTTIVGLGNRWTGNDCDGTRRGGLWTGGAGITGALKPDEYAVMDGPTWFKADAKNASSILGESVGDVGDFALEESDEKRVRNEDFVSHISSQPDLMSRETERGLGTVGGMVRIDDRLEANR